MEMINEIWLLWWVVWCNVMYVLLCAAREHMNFEWKSTTQNTKTAIERGRWSRTKDREGVHFAPKWDMYEMNIQITVITMRGKAKCRMYKFFPACKYQSLLKVKNNLFVWVKCINESSIGIISCCKMFRGVRCCVHNRKVPIKLRSSN